MGRGTSGRSPATVLAVIAMIVAVAGGSAYAGVQLGKKSVKSKHIAPNAVKAKHIARDAVSNKHTRNLEVSAVKNVPAFDGPFVDAPKVTLLRHGPFRFSGICLVDGDGVSADLQIMISRPGAVGTFAGNIHPTPGQLPENFLYNDAPLASANDTAGETIPFSLISGRSAVTGSVDAFAKDGTLPGGNGTYGAGNRCIYHATYTATG